MNSAATVLAVHRSADHRFSKTAHDHIELLEGLGVAGDAHAGATVQHRSRAAKDPTQPNLRQVHLIQTELFDDLQRHGFSVAPGQLGENITTCGIDLLALPQGTELQCGAHVVLRLTGLRNPCAQLDNFQRGLMAAVLERAADGTLVRKAGVMAVVVRSGVVTPGDLIVQRLPATPHQAMAPV